MRAHTVVGIAPLCSWINAIYYVKYFSEIDELGTELGLLSGQRDRSRRQEPKAVRESEARRPGKAERNGADDGFEPAVGTYLAMSRCNKARQLLFSSSTFQRQGNSMCFT